MGDANEGKKGAGEMEKLSMETNRNPRDLLQRFMATNQIQLISISKEEEEEEIELNLGLSLGGRFGVDRSDTKKKLTRSASIAACIPTVRDNGDALALSPVSYPEALLRASSLPVEREAEWRKRKELQSLRRMEAKRRRSEKQMNLNGERGGSGGGIEVNSRGRSEREQYMSALPKQDGLVAVPLFGLPNRAASTARHGGSGGGVGYAQQLEYDESQGGSSSGISEAESRPVQGSIGCGEASTSSIQLFQQTNLERQNACKSSIEMVTPSRPEAFSVRRGKETGSNSMDNMPCVFTQGNGPNGRRVEGILYKYGRREEVRIMCVCHGSFLSPAEFVQHAGGSNVAHPLKHIVVNTSSPTSFL